MAKNSGSGGSGKSNRHSDWTEWDDALPEDRVPPEWIEILATHESDIRRVRVEAKKGSGSYYPIPHGAWARVHEQPPASAARTEAEAADEETPADSHSDWSREMAGVAWRHVVEYARSDGPNIDSRIVPEKFDAKRGAFTPIKGATIAARCHLRPGGQEEHEIDPQVDFLRIQNTAIRDRDREIIELARAVTSQANALARAANDRLDLADRIGAKLESIGDRITGENQAQRDWVLQLLRTEEIGRTVRHGIEQLAPELRGMAEGFGRRADTIQSIARRVLESLSTDQIEQIREALNDRAVFDDLLAGLRGIADAADPDAAIAVVRRWGPLLAAHQNTVRPKLTDDQAADCLQILKIAGLV